MLDGQRSVPMAELLEVRQRSWSSRRSGDDDDKAFVMGLLLIRLVEYRRAPCGDTPASGTCW